MITFRRAAVAMGLVLGLVGGLAQVAWAQDGASDEPEPTGSIVPDDDSGAFPGSHYDIGYDEGAWNNLPRKFFGLLTDVAFAIARFLVTIGLWIITWAYGFGIAEGLGEPARSIGDAYQTELVGPIGLRHFALFCTLVWAGYQGLRGRLAVALGEVLLTIVIGVCGTFVLANPQGYLDGTLDSVSRVSGTLLALGTEQAPPTDVEGAQAVLEPLRANIHKAFIEDPYDVLSWGRPLTGACAEARDEILEDGPHGSDDEPRNIMSDAGCDDEADFNHDPTADRLAGAILTALVAGLAVVLLCMIAVTLLVAQIIVMVLFAAAPFALVAGLLPGSGRELLWRWVAALVRSMIVVVGMSFVLSLLLLTIDGLLEATNDVALIERFALVALVVVAMFIVRKRVVTSGAQLASRLSQRLTTTRAGGGGGLMGQAATGGISGYAIGASVREGAADLPGSAGRRLQHVRSGAKSRSIPSRRISSAPAGGGPGVGGAASSERRPGRATRTVDRVRETRAGHLAEGGAKAIGTTGSAVYKSTLGLPVHGPRAYHSAKSKVSAKHHDLAESVRDYKNEYRANLAKLRPGRTKN